MTSQQLHGRYYRQCICDNISPMFLTKYPLNMTSQHSVLMSPHSAYIWHPLHCRWHRIQSITQNNAIYDVTSTSRITSHPFIRNCTHCSFVITTSSLISHPFWMTSHPPSMLHPMPDIEHHIKSLCHHSTVLMTWQPLTMNPHPVCRGTYTLYMRHHSHYLCPHK